MYVHAYNNDAFSRACRDASWHMNGRADAELDNMYRTGHGENKWPMGWRLVTFHLHEIKMSPACLQHINRTRIISSLCIRSTSHKCLGLEQVFRIEAEQLMLLPTGSYANAVHVSLWKPETSVTNTGHCSEGGWEEVKMEEQRTDGQRE